MTLRGQIRAMLPEILPRCESLKMMNLSSLLKVICFFSAREKTRLSLSLAPMSCSLSGLLYNKTGRYLSGCKVQTLVLDYKKIYVNDIAR